MSGYGSDAGNPNYIESVASLKKKTKEDLRIDQLIPEEILTDSGDTGIKQVPFVPNTGYFLTNSQKVFHSSGEPVPKGYIRSSAYFIFK